jgi:hypothetical protein
MPTDHRPHYHILDGDGRLYATFTDRAAAARRLRRIRRTEDLSAYLGAACHVHLCRYAAATR